MGIQETQESLHRAFEMLNNTWQKKDNKPTTAKNIDFDVEKAIKLLKNNGFKIMKNISEWKEM